MKLSAWWSHLVKFTLDRYPTHERDNDQLAMGVAWRELAKRSARDNSDTPAGETLGRVATGVAEDVETFHGIMRRLGVRVSRVKTGLAIVAERVGRVKPNGRLGSYAFARPSATRG